MDVFFDRAFLEAKVRMVRAWFEDEVLVLANLGQLAVIGLTFLAARLVEPVIQRWFQNIAHGRRHEVNLRKVAAALAPLTIPVIWLVLQWVVVYVVAWAGWPHHLIKIVVSLLTAWVIIRLTTTLVRDPTWAKLVAGAAWTVAALNILNLLDPTIALLDDLSVTFSTVRISALTLIKGLFTLAVLLWVAAVLSRMLERRIKSLPNVTPSVQVLFAKLLKIVFLVTAVIVAMDTVGIDLSAFALFGGAVGVGVGFGLQKVVSNLISGVILLLDKSIKPGDVVTVGDTYGWINSLGARYASVITRDGMEHLIPNENLITQEVINWSFTGNEVRLHIPVGVAYHADVRKAMALCVEAAGECPRVLTRPEPRCLLTAFGENSVSLEIRFWINDPQNGTANARSQVLLAVWDRFHAEDIEIPFPQRDLHLKTTEIGVRIHQPAAARPPKKRRASSGGKAAEAE
jgi:small-conductance mechanosensitive channel